MKKTTIKQAGLSIIFIKNNYRYIGNHYFMIKTTKNEVFNIKKENEIILTDKEKTILTDKTTVDFNKLKQYNDELFIGKTINFFNKPFIDEKLELVYLNINNKKITIQKKYFDFVAEYMGEFVIYYDEKDPCKIYFVNNYVKDEIAIIMTITE